MADEDDVIEVVEEVEVDVVVDDAGNPVGAVVDDVIVERESDVAIPR